MRALACLSLLLLCAAAACPPPAPDDAGPGDAGPEESFRALLDEEGDVTELMGADGTVKYLAPVAGVEPRAPLFESCAFQDTMAFPFHLPFLNSLPGGDDLDFADYIALVLQRETRAWWGGEVWWRPELAHPIGGAPGVLAYTLYTEDSPGNRLIADDVRAVFAVLTACAPAFAGKLAFVPVSNEQRQTALQAQGELSADGIAVIIE
ncbi:MAG: hypothetical protein HYS27_11705 [Deltaproteobacteria bacterium]|nr:hypothetical protein [Deltaproteobacteria bacterium]